MEKRAPITTPSSNTKPKSASASDANDMDRILIRDGCSANLSSLCAVSDDYSKFGVGYLEHTLRQSGHFVLTFRRPQYSEAVLYRKYDHKKDTGYYSFKTVQTSVLIS